MVDPEVDLSKHVARLDVEKLADAERAELESVLSDWRTEAVDLRSKLDAVEFERDALRERVADLQGEVATLREDGETPRLAEPTAVFDDFKRSLAAADADLEGEAFAVSGLEVDLKAGVVGTEEGVRFHLPGPGETALAEGLSTVRFAVDARPEREESYVEVPDVRGMEPGAAARELENRGFAVSRTDVPGEPVGAVVGQRPDPYAVGPPGATVDLRVAVAVPEASETDAPSDETGADARSGESGANAGESETDERDATGVEDDAESADGRAGDARDERWAAVADLPVTAVDGIGPKYAERLGSADVETFADLVARDAESLAEAAGLSANRIRDWQHRAREHDPEAE